MIYFQLLSAFFKIGLFSFGGGYAMIPLMQEEALRHSWLTVREFSDVIAIAGTAPGPIAVNSAVFIGYRMSGIGGGITATIGVILPSLILALIVSRFLLRFRRHPIAKAAFYGIMPVTVGLIAGAAVFIGENSILKSKITVYTVLDALRSPLEFVHAANVIIMTAALVALVKSKASPVFVITVSGIVGIGLYYAGII